MPCRLPGSSIPIARAWVIASFSSRGIRIEIEVAGYIVAKTPPVAAGAEVPFSGIAAGIALRFQIIGD